MNTIKPICTMLLALLLPIFSAAVDTVRVDTRCNEGTAFSIRVPVRFPAGVTVVYEWYRNDTAVTEKVTLPTNERAIAYTIPDTAAFGDSLFFYFKYIAYEGDEPCDEWSESKRFVIHFTPYCRLYTLGWVEVGGAELECRLDSTGVIEVDYAAPPPELLCELESGGSIVVVVEEEVVTPPENACKLDGAGSVALDDTAVEENFCKLEGAGEIELVVND